MRRFIRLGDKTSHGGTVTSASSRMYVGGIPVACIGDTCTCPKKGHGNCVIVEGDDIMTVDGRAIALEGCKCSCGAVLISSMPNAGREYDGGRSSIENASYSVGNSPRQQISEAPTNTHPAIDEQIRIRDADGNPLANVPYYIVDEAGNSYRGFSDAQGCCERVSTNSIQELEILLGVPAMEKW